MTLFSIRKLVQPLLRVMVGEGLSGVKILDILRSPEVDLGYRTADVYKDIRKFTSALVKKPLLLKVPLRYRFPKELFTPSDIVVKKFEYVTEVTMIHRETKELKEREFIITSDRELTRDSIEYEATTNMNRYWLERDEEVFYLGATTPYYNPEKI